MSPIPTRRTLLRTAAWSVPAVTVATAAPAFAASNPDAGLLRINQVEARWRDPAFPSNEYALIRLTVTNLDLVTTAGALSFNLIFPNSWVGDTIGILNLSGTASLEDYGSGWEKHVTTYPFTAGSRTGLVPFTLSGIGAGTTSAELSFTAATTRLGNHSNLTDPLLITPTWPTNFGPATGSISAVAVQAA